MLQLGVRRALVDGANGAHAGDWKGEEEPGKSEIGDLLFLQCKLSENCVITID